MTQDTLTVLRAALTGLETAHLYWHGMADDYKPKILDLRTLIAATEKREPQEKIAPVQGYTPGIPWSLHLEAYDVYCKKWSPQPALIDLEGRNCRGGFGTSELDEFIPGWRDKVSEIVRLKAEIADLKKAHAQPVEQPSEVERLTAQLKQANAQTEEFERKWYLACDENERLKGLMEEYLDITEPPEANCRCHLCPPCNDCVDNGGWRDAFNTCKSAIARAALKETK